jgi:hydroxyethylthiazole kinase-like uncharacterized protein yjeF
MKPAPAHLPRPVLPALVALALHDVAASRLIETRTQASLAHGALMRAAGRSVARWAMAMAPHARRVWIAAGPGGNGGDGLHAAAELRARGLSVTVTLCARPEQLPPDAQEGLQRAVDCACNVMSTLPEGSFDLVVDALLGLGAGRAPQGDLANAVAAINASSGPRLAVDLPTGIAGDTGSLLGSEAVRATATLSLLTLKPGLFTAQGRDHAGEIWFDRLGAPNPIVAGPDAPTAWLTGRNDSLYALEARRHVQHKGSFGDVVVIGGAPSMVGAARLAAHGALGAGAGRTFLSLLEPSAPMGDATRPEWLWLAKAWLPGQAALEQSTVVCGCGGGQAVREALPAVLSRSARLVLDADALNALATDTVLRRLLAARGRRGLPTVLTPHPLEAARLLGCHTNEIQNDRLRSAAALASDLDSVVVLKGSGTVIAAPGHVRLVNSTGNAALASGGTGDVLAGWIGGLWAQADVAADHGDRFDSALRCATASVWLHGAAADAGNPNAVRALDLVDAMRALRAGLSAP